MDDLIGKFSLVLLASAIFGGIVVALIVTHKDDRIDESREGGVSDRQGPRNDRRPLPVRRFRNR